MSIGALLKAIAGFGEGYREVGLEQEEKRRRDQQLQMDQAQLKIQQDDAARRVREEQQRKVREALSTTGYKGSVSPQLAQEVRDAGMGHRVEEVIDPVSLQQTFASVPTMEEEAQHQQLQANQQKLTESDRLRKAQEGFYSLAKSKPGDWQAQFDFALSNGIDPSHILANPQYQQWVGQQNAHRQLDIQKQLQGYLASLREETDPLYKALQKRALAEQMFQKMTLDQQGSRQDLPERDSMGNSNLLNAALNRIEKVNAQRAAEKQMAEGGMNVLPYYNAATAKWQMKPMSFAPAYSEDTDPDAKARTTAWVKKILKEKKGTPADNIRGFQSLLGQQDSAGQDIRNEALRWGLTPEQVTDYLDSLTKDNQKQRHTLTPQTLSVSPTGFPMWTR